LIKKINVMKKLHKKIKITEDLEQFSPISIFTNKENVEKTTTIF